MICVAVTYVVKPGREEEAVRFLKSLAAASRTEPGCRMYLVHRSLDDPQRFFLYEQYEDQQALDAHRAAPHFQEYGVNGVLPLLESRSPELYKPLEDEGP